MRPQALIGLIGLSVMLAGCVGASGLGAFLGAMLLAVAVVLQACDTTPGDSSVQDAQVDSKVEEDAQPDATSDTPETDTGECDGTWQQACVEGQLVQACCPAGAICNYWHVACDDGTCVEPGETCGGADVIEADTMADVTGADATEDTGPAPECLTGGDPGHWETSCQNGQLVDVCCPNGMECNYGMGVTTCGDGTCVNYPDECAKEEPCDGNWETGCVDGVLTPLCCPEGMVCNYGMGVTDCGDGTCTSFGQKCPPEETCDGNWESACVDGQVTQLCCPEGMACNYGMTMQICDDGSCVNMPDSCETKPPECDGTWESACQDGQVVDMCCPAGMACNFGELMVLCDDGSCVNQPDTCGKDDGCDGYWGQVCQDGHFVEACCPAGMICNFGMLTVDCGDGTCVNMPDECPVKDPPKDECSGYWATTCDAGHIVEVCCPEGMACNYGWGMEDCGDGTCAMFPETCAADEK